MAVRLDAELVVDFAVVITVVVLVALLAPACMVGVVAIAVAGVVLLLDAVV